MVIRSFHSVILQQAASAFFPTRTTMRSRGKSPRSCLRCGSPRLISPVFVSFRGHGTMFQVIVRSRSMPAVALSSNQFLAVGSGLLREINPVRTACFPGVSKRNKHSAWTPPSRGSKSGISSFPIERLASREFPKGTSTRHGLPRQEDQSLEYHLPIDLRNEATNFFSRHMRRVPSLERRRSHCAGSRKHSGSSMMDLTACVVISHLPP